MSHMQGTVNQIPGCSNIENATDLLVGIRMQRKNRLWPFSDVQGDKPQARTWSTDKTHLKIPVRKWRKVILMSPSSLDW